VRVEAENAGTVSSRSAGDASTDEGHGEKMRDLEQYAADELAEQFAGKKGSAADLVSEIEDADHAFDFDSYAPYTAQEDEILSDYDRECWREADELADGGQEYKPSQWAEAKRHYVSCLAYAAFSALFESAKSELSERVTEFADYLTTEYEIEPEITISTRCPHGWASHTREIEDGTMLFESGQLDGCNGACVEVGGCWLSACWTPKPLPAEA
jgi:hypothetical protein